LRQRANVHDKDRHHEERHETGKVPEHVWNGEVWSFDLPRIISNAGVRPRVL
jgi:hypothetical protein